MSRQPEKAPVGTTLTATFSSIHPIELLGKTAIHASSPEEAFTIAKTAFPYLRHSLAVQEIYGVR